MNEEIIQNINDLRFPGRNRSNSKMVAVEAPGLHSVVKTWSEMQQYNCQKSSF